MLLTRHMRSAVLLAGLAVTRVVAAQSVHAPVAATTVLATTDPRWLPWLGCWTPDIANADDRSTVTITCIVPAPNTRGVDALTIARGEVIARNRLDAGTRPHPVEGQGCRGTETVTWSESGRQVFLHSDYTCSHGTPGTSSTIFALSAGGQWLRLDRSHSAKDGNMVVTRFVPVAAPMALPSGTVRLLDKRRDEIVAARAAAAAPITTDEIIDAAHTSEPDLVRAWVAANDQAIEAPIVASSAAAAAPPVVIYNGVDAGYAAGMVYGNPYTPLYYVPSVVVYRGGGAGYAHGRPGGPPGSAAPYGTPAPARPRGRGGEPYHRPSEPTPKPGVIVIRKR